MICEWKTGKIKYTYKDEKNNRLVYYFQEDGNHPDLKNDPFYRIDIDKEAPLNENSCYIYLRYKGEREIMVYYDEKIYHFIAHCDREFQRRSCSDCKYYIKEGTEECEHSLKETCKTLSEDILALLELKASPLNSSNEQLINWLRNGDFTPHKGCYSRLYYIQNVYADSKNVPRLSLDDDFTLSYNGCDTMLYFYSCRYTFEYCREFIYALCQVLPSLFKDYNQLNILSWGCGNAVDLFAFDYVSRNYSFPRIAYYHGLDMCEQWDQIHKDIKDLFSGSGTAIRFSTGDKANIETYFDNPENEPLEGYNVLVLSYLISILYRKALKEPLNKVNGEITPEQHAANKMKDLYKNLIENVIKNKPSGKPMLIIMNDIYGYQTYETFKEMIEQDKELKIKGKPILCRLKDIPKNDASSDFSEDSDIERDDTNFIICNPPEFFDNDIIYHESGYCDPKNGSITDYQTFYFAPMHPKCYQLILEVE